MSAFLLHMLPALFVATILTGVLAGSAMTQAPAASCALPSEPEGIPAALDAAITGPADKDRVCMKALLIPEARLMDVRQFFTTVLNIGGSLEISNPDAKLLDADFFAITADGNYVDYFIYTKTGSKPVTCLFVYADSETTVTGGKNVSVALQRGWNRIYCTFADKKATSTAPGGMKWYLNKDVKQ